MSNYYIRNMETGKIELHFDKDDYMALSQEEKKKIKSNFLFSRGTGAWISRCKFPNLYRSESVAKELGLEDAGRKGETLSFGKQMERKMERAERRAEHMEYKAEKAIERGEALQKPINDMHGDIAFFTQPNINSAGGRAFTRRRERMFASWERGFEEFKKSEYYEERARIARETARGDNQKDKAFCQRRIDEAEASIRRLKRSINKHEGYKKQIENGEEPTNEYGWKVDMSLEDIEKHIDYLYEMMEQEIGKYSYYHECIEAHGGIAFNKDNIKKGDILKIKRFYGVETVRVINRGTKNITYAEISRDGWGGKCPYSEIIEKIETA